MHIERKVKIQIFGQAQLTHPSLWACTAIECTRQKSTTFSFYLSMHYYYSYDFNCVCKVNMRLKCETCVLCFYSTSATCLLPPDFLFLIYSLLFPFVVAAGASKSKESLVTRNDIYFKIIILHVSLISLSHCLFIWNA